MDFCFIDVGIVPRTRPCEISNGVSLSDKLGRKDRAFVPKRGAVDSLLTAGVDEAPPDKESVGIEGSQDDLFAGAAEERAHATVTVLIGAVVPLVEFKTGWVAVFREIPVWHITSPPSPKPRRRPPMPARCTR